jgi:hypothetical protein
VARNRMCSFSIDEELRVMTVAHGHAAVGSLPGNQTTRPTLSSRQDADYVAGTCNVIRQMPRA